MLKKVGYCLYAHKSNIDELKSKLDENMNNMLKAVICIVEKELDIPYHIIKVNTKDKKISVIECFDWDKVAEPIVGDSFCFNSDLRYSMKKGGKTVYHHKWMFVSDDYLGFDLEANKKRSVLLNNIPEFINNKKMVGHLNYWCDFLNRYKISR